MYVFPLKVLAARVHLNVKEYSACLAFGVNRREMKALRQES